MDAAKSMLDCAESFKECTDRDQYIMINTLGHRGLH